MERSGGRTVRTPDPDVNYIVSGLERSGTSMMMQILHRGGAPVAFDRSRQADYHNPKGYFELEGGKIINRLMEGTFPFDQYRGIFVKITAYGLQYLPSGPGYRYKVIYMQRSLDEILTSMEKMSGPLNREEERPAFEHLHRFALKILRRRENIDYLLVPYRQVVHNPVEEIDRINRFLGGMLSREDAVRAVDPDLYRNVKK